MSFFRSLILLIVSITLVSCTSSQKNTSVLSRSQTQTLHLNIGAEPTILNPLLITDSASHSVTQFIFNGLFKLDENLEIVPDLVDTYTISSNGLVYTFTLKEGVYWHDGQVLTAEDVKFTFDTLIDKNTNTVRRSQFILDEKPIQWTVLNPKTIQATLPAPFAPFLSTLVMEIIPKHVYSTEAINTHPANRTPIGTGPFAFVEWKSGQYIKLKRNIKFFKGKPKLHSIICKIIPDTNTSLSAFEKGELDIAGIPHKDIPRFQKNKSIALFSNYGLSYSYMAFNLRKPILGDVRVRRAITHAINKDALIQAILKGNGTPAHIPSSPISWGYPDDDHLKTYPYDPEKAKALLKEAGYQLNPATKWVEKDGKPFVLNLKTSKGSASSIQMAQIIQQFLKQVGIKMEIETLEWSSFLKVIHDTTEPRNFDLVILGWTFDINDPDDTYTVWHSSAYPNGANLNGYSNARVDQLLDLGRKELDKDKRKAIYTEIFNQISLDAPYVFLFHAKSSVGVYTYVKGLVTTGKVGLLNAIENVYIEE